MDILQILLQFFLLKLIFIFLRTSKCIHVVCVLIGWVVRSSLESVWFCVHLHPEPLAVRGLLLNQLLDCPTSSVVQRA